MVNLFIQEPIYITIQELKDSSNNQDIKLSTNDDNLKILISKAQDVIDYIIWDYWIKLLSTQNNIFPEKTLWVPLNIKKACILLCDNMYVWWVLSWWAYNWNIWNIKSETYRWTSVQYFDTWEILKNQFADNEVMLYLNDYTSSLSSKWFKNA